jgi:acyl phosphate:glycerol-3-phosphate acyltransferase
VVGVFVAAAVLAGAYFLGGFPTAAVVGRRAGFDPESAGSGNPGASNSFRLGGAVAGAAVLAGDVAKGAASAAAGLAFGGRALGLAAAAAAVIGHVAPIGRRFHGGKGVATTIGAVAVLVPLAAVVGAAAWVAVVAATRTAALASIAMMGVFVLVIAVSRRPGWEVVVLGGVAVIVVLRHRDNLARLRRGDEPSLDPKGIR